MTFWDHLDVLRASIMRCLVIVTALTIIAFIFKDEVFDIVMAPKEGHIRLINTGLATQFVTHVTVSIYTGLLAGLPYILYEVFRFISPALYNSEKRVVTWVVLSSYFLFMAGVAFNYFAVFPTTITFLGNYQVDTQIENLISLESYIDTLLIMSITLGLVFEIPILSWMLGKIGLVKKDMMREYRRHAIVAILIIAAMVTPTSDAFTLAIVSLPMILLYEFSILLVHK